MSRLPLLTVRDFRSSFHRLTEPVQVIRSRGNVRIIGTWTPEKGDDPHDRAVSSGQSKSTTPERTG